MKTKPAYYTVFDLKDGTITSAVQTRKPLKSQLRPRERVDVDGIWRSYKWTAKNFYGEQDRKVIISQLAMAGRLNTRRAIHELVEPRVERIEMKLEMLTKQLERIGPEPRHDR